MWQKNNGKSETEIVQNRFTAYLATAVKRRSNDYLQQQDRRQQIESLTEDYPFFAGIQHRAGYASWSACAHAAGGQCASLCAEGTE